MIATNISGLTRMTRADLLGTPVRVTNIEAAVRRDRVLERAVQGRR